MFLKNQCLDSLEEVKFVDQQTAHKHTNMLWIFLGLIFCALFLVFSLPKGMKSIGPTGAVVSLTPAASIFSTVIIVGLLLAAALIGFVVFGRNQNS